MYVLIFHGRSKHSFNAREHRGATAANTKNASLGRKGGKIGNSSWKRRKGNSFFPRMYADRALPSKDILIHFPFILMYHACKKLAFKTSQIVFEY